MASSDARSIVGSLPEQQQQQQQQQHRGILNGTFAALKRDRSVVSQFGGLFGAPKEDLKNLPNIDDDDDEDEEDFDKNLSCWCTRCLKGAYNSFAPGTTPILLLFIIIIIIFSLIMRRISLRIDWSIDVYAIYFGIVVACLFAWLIVRFVWVHLVARYFCSEGRFIASIISILDPHLAYFLWSLSSFLFFMFMFSSYDTHPSLSTLDGTEGTEASEELTYYCLAFSGRHFCVDNTERNTLQNIEILALLWTLRNVIVNVAMFYFLLGFSHNFNAHLIRYLNLYSLLRRLQANWIRLVPQGGDSQEEADECDSLIHKDANNDPNNDPMVDLERGSTTDGALKDIPQQAVAALSRLTSNVLAPLPKTHKQRAAKFKVEYNTGRILPRVLQDKTIEKTTKDQLANLTAIQFCKTYPPVLFAGGIRYELHSKKIARSVGESIFDELVEFREAMGWCGDGVVGTSPEELDAAAKVNFINQTIRIDGRLVHGGSIGRPSVTSKAPNSSFLRLGTLQTVIEQDIDPVSERSGTRLLLVPTEEKRRSSTSSAASHKSHTTGGTNHHRRGSVEMGSTGQASRRSSVATLLQRRFTRSPPVSLRQMNTQPLSSDTDSDSDDDRGGIIEFIADAQAVEEQQRHRSSVNLEAFGDAVSQYHIQPRSDPATDLRSTPSAEFWSATIGQATGHFGRGSQSDMDDQSRRTSLATFTKDPTNGAAVQPVAELDLERERIGSNDSLSSRPRFLETESERANEVPVIRKVVNHEMGLPDNFDTKWPGGVGPVPKQNDIYLTRELFSLFLHERTDIFLRNADRGGRGRVNRKQFSRLTVSIYKLRKQLLAILSSQDGIQKNFRLLLQVLLTMLFALIYLVAIGVAVNTIIVSGAAALSAIMVALSFFYSSFLQSVTFVCFVNPYSVGDRVRILGDIMTVKKVTTFFSEFNDTHGKPTIFNHTFLYNQKIINESRSLSASLELIVLIADSTPPIKYQRLKDNIKQFCQQRQEYVKDSAWFILNEIALGHYLKFTVWVNTVDGWHHYKSVWASRGLLWQYILHQCEVMGIQYKLPIQRYEPNAPMIPQSSSSNTSQLLPPPSSLSQSLYNNNSPPTFNPSQS